MSAAREDRLAALAALAEPLRRSLFLYVSEATDAVSRDDAATVLDVSRSVAAFHLDKLAELGLLEVEYRRPPGRRGPGAGRPAKLYRRAHDEVAFTVPERHYDLAASILAAAVAEAREDAVPVDRALRDAAQRCGRDLVAAPDDAPGPGSGVQALGRVAEVLTTHGYEPRLEGDRVTLENCPFHALAEQHRELVCTMNLDMVKGVLDGAGATDVEAALDPAPGRCCVTLRAR